MWSVLSRQVFLFEPIFFQLFVPSVDFNFSTPTSKPPHMPMTSRVGSSLTRLQCPAQDSLDLSSPLLAAYHCIIITIASIYSSLVISKCRASTSSNLSLVCQYSNKLYPNSNCNSNLPVFMYTFIVVNDTVV